jgi:hypothetical protein
MSARDLPMMSNVSSEDKNQQIIVRGDWAGRLARFRDPDRTLDTFDFDFNKKIEPPPDLRACAAHAAIQQGIFRTCSLGLPCTCPSNARSGWVIGAPLLSHKFADKGGQLTSERTAFHDD